MPGVIYDESPNAWQTDHAVGIRQAAAAARAADVIVCCVGENSYCETPGNMDDLNLSAKQKELVRALAATGKPLVLVLNEGRPRIIGDIEPLATAVVDVMLPSNYGGDALAALLAGDENFSGKLPFTYSKHINSLHTYDYKVSEHREVMGGTYNYDAIMDVQWPFGFGLSYTTFSYGDLKLESPADFKAGDVLKVSVKVTNNGSVAGKEAVQVYISAPAGSLDKPVKELKAFAKTRKLAPGESQTLDISFAAADMSSWDESKNGWVLDPGTYQILVGASSADIRATASVDVK